MRRRMAVAVLALIGLFISLYLLLYHMGWYGGLACGSGAHSCEYVQSSRYASFLGWPVPGWGVAWYGSVFGIALLGVQPTFGEHPWTGKLLSLLAVGGLAFTVYLTSVELFVLRAVCRWCVGSAVIATAIFLLVAWGWGKKDGAPGGREA